LNAEVLSFYDHLGAMGDKLTGLPKGLMGDASTGG
jgi:hypothetical protein